MESLAIPSLQSGSSEIDAAFRIAVGTIASNIRDYKGGLLKAPAPAFIAGFDYDMPWTRDASFNAWFCGGLLAPEVAKNSLLANLTETPKLQIWDHQYWDSVIWAWGAWNYYLQTGDREFLKIAIPASENTLKERIADEKDEKDGLFRGGACFQDGIAGYPDKFISLRKGSGILDCLNDKPDFMAPTGGGLPMKALSTNCLYLMAFEAVNAMRKELGLAENPDFAQEAASLRKTIHKKFWSEQTQSYRYLLDAADPNRERQEGLGSAFALISGIAPAKLEGAVVAHQHIATHGIPCVWPSYERYSKRPGDYGRHSGTIWPQVNATWCNALALHGFKAEAFKELRLLAEKAKRDAAFFELYHPETGLPYGGLQENGEKSGIEEWKSCRCQTWCATGFINMVLSTIFGMRFSASGLSFDPYLQEGVAHAQLSGLHYRKAILNIEVNRGDKMTVAINGKKASTLSSECEDLQTISLGV